MIIASIYPCPFDRQDRHEFNASVLKGEEFYSYEEGKLTSVKNDGTLKFPERALMLGFKELNITPDQVDKWVFPTPGSEIELKDYFLFFSWFFKAYSGDYQSFEKWFDDNVVFIDHQLSHAALAVYASPFPDCAFLCMDGGGDFGDKRGYVFGEYISNNFDFMFESSGIDTIANFHSFATDAIGFSGDDNGKTSGLASYGNVDPILKEKLSELVIVSAEGGVKFERKRFSRTAVNINKVRADAYDRTKIFSMYPSDSNILRLSIEYLPHDIAATCEEILREKVIELLALLRTKTKKNSIVFSGGLFQNVSLNNALISQSGFENVFFPSAPSDSGLSLGAALYVKNENKNNGPTTLSAYLGPSFSSEEVGDILKRYRLNYSVHSDIAKVVAKQITDGKTVGWFQGKAEFGPRSLGARSLVADPRSIVSKEKINQLLKKRDWFMPYAPSILAEELSNWVDQEDYYSPYMQVAFDVKSEVVDKIPSAVHVDGTSRMHVVREIDNPLYWELIHEFKKLTGVPMILNTSFNRHGISTISTPRQAVEHLLEGCMDFLAIDKYLISFEDNRLVNNQDSKIEPESILLNIGAVERLSVFESYGTYEQMKEYLLKLSNLTGMNISCTRKKEISYLGEELSLPDAIYNIKKGMDN